MFIDLTDENLQPTAINVEIPEIILSQPIRERLQSAFEEEENFARIYAATSVVKPDNNYVFFSNHWFYLAVLCKRYAQALYPYCVFFDNRIRNNQEITRDLAAERYDNPEFVALFDNDEDRERMVNFIRGDSDYRPGKALLNIRDGNRVTTRSSKDIFGSCVLKKLAVPDASSGYLGNVIFYLAKNDALYADLETEINQILQEANGQENPATIVRPATGGINKIFYGAPGCGKSRYVADLLRDANVSDDNVVRVTFHPEYTNVDFIGQILPTIEQDEDGNDIVKYIFNLGSFSLALQKAYNTTDMVYLIIEEINRGNAAAIFGDMFQLLDRERDTEKPNFSASEYPVSNPNLQKYLIGKVENETIKANLENGIYIPSNLTIFATMNSSDQNVFTLDTAFKRRWSFEQISNDIERDTTHAYKGWYVPGTDKTWETFLTRLNDKILDYKIHNQTNEDKRLGKYFVTQDCLTEQIQDIADVQDAAMAFAYKVLEYTWNDVCKIGREEWFDTEKYKTLEQLIDAFMAPADGETPLSVFQNITF